MNKKLTAFFALLLTPLLAHAHNGDVHLADFTTGFIHPFSGIDHIIAMLAVGVWAKQRGGSHLYLLPLTFVSIMAVAAFIGMAGISMAYTETGIMASNAVLIALLLLNTRFATPVSMAIVGFFALFHGVSHGSEMPLEAESITYMSGFVCATVLLHSMGLGLAWMKIPALWRAVRA